jgi:type IV pilus assembly protein PilA
MLSMQSNLPRRTRAGLTEDREAGFTLIEVMVVVMIIGILLAVGVPTFLGARSRAQDRSAQSSIRIGQTTALVVFTDTGDLDDVDTTKMAATEPGVTWVGGTTASASEDTVSVGVNTAGSELGAAAMSDSGTCFYIRLRESASTLYGESTTAACTGDTALTQATASEW